MREQTSQAAGFPATFYRTLGLLILSLSLAASVYGQDNDQTRQRLEYEQNTVDVVSRATSSVVAVNIAVKERRSTPSWALRSSKGAEAALWSLEGRIITNFHVIALALEDAGDEDLGLLDLLEPQGAAVEGAGFGLGALGHGDLHVIQAQNHPRITPLATP